MLVCWGIDDNEHLVVFFSYLGCVYVLDCKLTIVDLCLSITEILISFPKKKTKKKERQKRREKSCEKGKQKTKKNKKREWKSWLALAKYVACVPCLSTHFLHYSLGYVHWIVGV